MVRLKNCVLLNLFSMLILVGCTTPKPIYYSSGKDAHILSCTGATWSGCLRDAGQICVDKGYEVLEKSSGREYGFFYDNTVKEMVISCGLPAPVAVLAPSQESPKAVPNGVKLGEVSATPPVSESVATKVTPRPKTPKEAAVESDSSGLLIKQ